MLESICCGAEPWGDTDLCGDCKEHTEFINIEDEI